MSIHIDTPAGTFDLILTPAQAARLLRIGRTRVTELLDTGEFPTKTIQLGQKRPEIVTIALLEHLGVPYTLIANDTNTPKETTPQ